MPELDQTWSPLSPAEVGTAMAGASFDWWLAGGYALELFVGRAWRAHDDIDILVLRPDLAAALDHFASWDIWLADPPGHLRPLIPEDADTKAHDIWLRQQAEAPWALQIMVDEAKDNLWQSRRNMGLTLPRNDLGWRHESDLPCIAPQVQLFYKAKAPREKDETDFAQVAPSLDAAQRQWLRNAVTKTYGETHRWLRALA